MQQSTQTVMENLQDACIRMLNALDVKKDVIAEEQAEECEEYIKRLSQIELSQEEEQDVLKHLRTFDIPHESFGIRKKIEALIEKFSA
ncbi:MAG: hypothetical protein COU08_03010 [Candidatus Harrisonbacteria bacterium CG10_big_fil_rev_8_21_14_0_10_42_17]|uniref:Uncharacterized protein n=1 Tax=Candidatus Harrisonbacteria bacterium CG10_big_fil_rev_8_21_14_0_10_42_17 TaxID=1974584 RepID=A0A2M6WHI5_9BACT|nr:MAG: hypothetical protein COU08_03010 [Candidatus Harrisonbacteria bacterium CG10_big_fil_rev_8_21_14_0_10_42_17]